jgi:hypothetical protein
MLATYEPPDGDDADRDGIWSGGNVAHVDPEPKVLYIEFSIGEHPHMPRKCENFLWFSSKFSGQLIAEPYNPNTT